MDERRARRDEDSHSPRRTGPPREPGRDGVPHAGSNAHAGPPREDGARRPPGEIRVRSLQRRADAPSGETRAPSSRPPTCAANPPTDVAAFGITYSLSPR